MKNFIIVALFSWTVSGCAVTSFSPPDVAVGIPDNPDLLSSLQVVDSFILQYRKRARSSADGRRYFELPPIIGSVGAVTAAALGASSDVTIATGAGGALLGSSKAYFDPRAKSAVYDSAIGAFLCVQQVATGVLPFAQAAPGTAGRAAAESANGDSYAYYLLVRNAALSIERIAAQRLSAAGSSTDAEGIVAQYEKTIAEKRAKETDASKKLVPAMAGRGASHASEDQLERLNAMQPDLQLCVLRAKI